MTTKDSSADPFAFWREMFQKSTEAWSQAAAGSQGAGIWPKFFGAAPGGTMPGFGGAPGSNPFGQFMPPLFSNEVQKMWQQFYNSWAEQAQQAMASGTPGPEAFANAQKQWSEQLEAMARTFAEVMGTESFANMMGRYMEQSLVWQQRMANAMGPQQDDMLKTLNMPSRGQIDRLFERVIGLEDRIDDLEDENRKLRTQVEATLQNAAPRSRARSQEAPAASE